ncbi:hypothetical protein D3C76_1733330 [compost metagenome]
MILDQIGGMQLDLGSFEYDEADPRPYAEQYAAWQLTRDTRECDLSSYPGCGDEQATRGEPPVVVTKRRR